MIDMLVLQQMDCFSLVGQRHLGWVGFVQQNILNSLQCIWFDRGETRDKEYVKRRLTEHVKDTSRNPLLVFPEGTCVNNKFCIQFKKGVFQLGVPVYPIAIKYNQTITDCFWNSRRESFSKHLFRLMSSWCVVCDVWYLEPQTIRKGETTVEFANRVRNLIASKAGLCERDWDGYWKHYHPTARYKMKRQEKIALALKKRLLAKSDKNHENERNLRNRGHKMSHDSTN